LLKPYSSRQFKEAKSGTKVSIESSLEAAAKFTWAPTLTCDGEVR
jgi:hypothetical protein